MTPCQTLETVTYHHGVKRIPHTIPARGAWFPEGLHAVEIAKRVARICATCPEQDACLSGAIERRERYGVWGGRWFEGGGPWRTWTGARGDLLEVS